MAAYMTITGSTATEAEEYVDELTEEKGDEDDGSADDDQAGGSDRDGPKQGRVDAGEEVLDVAELHRMLDDMVEKTFPGKLPGKRRRRRR